MNIFFKNRSQGVIITNKKIEMFRRCNVDQNI